MCAMAYQVLLLNKSSNHHVWEVSQRVALTFLTAHNLLALHYIGSFCCRTKLEQFYLSTCLVLADTPVSILRKNLNFCTSNNLSLVIFHLLLVNWISLELYVFSCAAWVWVCSKEVFIFRLLEHWRYSEINVTDSGYIQTVMFDKMRVMSIM